ncbi:YajQ family cyclic di-GMP-binding protein [Ignavibacteria bacterium]|nr:YajQ family cyclic di-GMP-binding protein [Bacteroidota bacterium]MCZ2133016.1 YajQ family cyclic di-GMP-binding protein [Bacteroidota bacterium]
MADSYSFDVVSEVNMQEIDNAVNQAKKDLANRYDLRGSNAEISFDPKQKTISVAADGEHFIEPVREIIQQKCFKRGISIVSLKAGNIDHTGGKTHRQIITIKNGLDRDEAKKITQLIKDAKLKAQAQIQDEQVRVTGKSKDDLQKVIALLKSADLDFPVQFINYR